MLIVLQAVILYAIAYVLWKLLLRQFFVKSALDNIPGPPSQSFLFGDFFGIVSLSHRLLHLQVFSHSFSTPREGNFTKISNRNV